MNEGMTEGLSGIFKFSVRPCTVRRQATLTAALLMVVCPMYRILYSPGTLYLKASYVPYKAPARGMGGRQRACVDSDSVYPCRRKLC